MIKPTEYNLLKIFRRTDFRQEFRLKQSDGTTAVDLTGYTGAFNVLSRDDDSVVATASIQISAPTTGVVTAVISDAITSSIPIDSYRCELLLTVGGNTDAWLYGIIKVL